MSNSEGSPTRGDLVDAYITVEERPMRTYMMRTDMMKTGDIVNLVRVEPNEFQFIYVGLGKVYFFHDTALTQLIDQRHVVLPETAVVDIWTSRSICGKEEPAVNYWVKIGIRRDSVEMVSQKICFSVRPRLFLDIRFGGGFTTEYHALRQGFDKWKTCKQFLMESLNAYVGVGLSPPADVIKMELYEHQKQGLRWMVDREELPYDDDNELPPFWEERNGMYRTEVSCLLTFKRPQKLRGGILADESGMGKTLTLLSLIAYTKRSTNNVARASSSATCHVKKKQKVHNLPVEDVEESRPTLVVCPRSVLATWKGQIEQFTWPGSLKVCTYSRKNKTDDPNFLMQHDLVLTTYDILKKEESDSANSSVLNHIDWWRVIFDDVHVLLKGSHCYKPTFTNLKAKCRWAVTGKPVHVDYHNYSIIPIVNFLQVQQFCYTVHPLFHLEVLMGIYSLRRTMPVKFIENHMVVMSKDEQNLYDTTEVDAKVAAGAANGFEFCYLQAAILHLWKSCNGLVLCSLSCTGMNVASIKIRDLRSKPKLLKKWVTMLEEENDYSCPICMDRPDEIVITRCTHMFCRSCIMRVFEKHESRKSICPLCRDPLTKKDIFSAQTGPSVLEKMNRLTENEDEDESSSAKVSSKVSTLLNLLVKSRSEYPNMKAVVLSQFRRMLMLVACVLSEASFNVRIINVTDNGKTKAKTVEEFSNAEGPVVLLTTFNTLSNTPGLDLSAASNAYMIEPCWNAHTEEGALRRIDRLGRKDDVNVVRLICKNSIEERVLELRAKNKAYGKLSSRREVNVGTMIDNKRLLGL